MAQGCLYKALLLFIQSKGPMHQPAGVVANTLCCKPSCSPCRRRRYRKCAVRDSKDSIVAPVYYFISLSLPPPLLSGPTNPDLPSQVSLHFGSRACKIDRAMDGSQKNSTLNGTTLSIFSLEFFLSPLLFQSTHSTQIAPVAPASASIRRRQPPPPQPQHGGAAP